MGSHRLREDGQGMWVQRELRFINEQHSQFAMSLREKQREQEEHL